jgi:hypothetical protein
MNSMNRLESQNEGESYKMQILSQYQNAEITNLIDQIKSTLKEESNYISLDLSVF